MKGYTISTIGQSILLFKINRPEKRNAVNYEVMDGLEEAISLADQDEAIKIMAITGEGEKAFCSGGDLSEFHGLKTEEEAFWMLSRMGGILYRLAVLPKPTLAVINGSAVGGGCEIAAACDFRIASINSKMGFIQGNLGITTGWGGASLLFERIQASDALKLLCESSIKDVHGLKEIGFIQEISDFWSEEKIVEFTQQMLQKETAVLSAYKSSLVQKWKVTGLKDRIYQEIKNCSVLWESDAHHKAVDRFLKN
ncbi:enoyl-CoA hydratase/isomerase family protein [Falsibacillus pallidus]|uniref:Enoyl-CoA hydratase/carnithine racemase n=1 Tax=Falsibacillus pallidus TaxID=493781 RepID=A0A370GV73_9BACI|nr:enoyl-CoA hydratase/isomerase family protein [Falsibacillus pallidus]RDI47567.1 enoyl-CoA hydratase/carnithine racemase [Falsibacillus pallidus]